MLNFPTFPITFCVFTCWVPPSRQIGALVTAIFAANGGTFLAVRPVALICYPWIQVIYFIGFINQVSVVDSDCEVAVFITDRYSANAHKILDRWKINSSAGRNRRR